MWFQWAELPALSCRVAARSQWVEMRRLIGCSSLVAARLWLASRRLPAHSAPRAPLARAQPANEPASGRTINLTELQSIHQLAGLGARMSAPYCIDWPPAALVSCCQCWRGARSFAIKLMSQRASALFDEINQRWLPGRRGSAAKMKQVNLLSSSTNNPLWRLGRGARLRLLIGLDLSVCLSICLFACLFVCIWEKKSRSSCLLCKRVHLIRLVT